MALDEIIKDSIFIKSFLMGSGAMLYGFVTYSIGYAGYKLAGKVYNKVSDYLDKMFIID